MSRRHRAEKREVLPDPKFGDVVLSRFMNVLMYDGKKSTAERIVYAAMDTLKKRGGPNSDPLRLFHEAMDNVKPAVEVRSRRVGGATYQVPVEVRPERRQALAIRWLIESARRVPVSTIVEPAPDTLPSGAVMLRDVRFRSVCEHHLLLFRGKAHIAYLPNQRVVGISKLARLVEAFAKRLQIQERMTAQIADALDIHLQPLGVAVVIECRHMCMESRGIKHAGTATVTSALRGSVKNNPDTRREFLALIGK